MVKALRFLIIGLLVGVIVGMVMTERKVERKKREEEEAFANDPEILASRREFEEQLKTDKRLKLIWAEMEALNNAEGLS
jgi:hypothetical protein